MKVSMNWLKTYADIPISPAEYESRMIMTGTGVEGIEEMGADIQNVVVGRVLTCAAHENSDHLHVCTVDVGEDAHLQIVCGAPNVREGLLVPVAKVGAKLPGGIEIKKGKLRGIESYGMLCSSTELNVPVELYPSVGDAGLLIFNEDYAPGTDVKKIFGFNDHVIEFEILANRPDCLCVWGVARETAAAMGTTLKLPEITVQEAGGDIHDMARVTVLDDVLCPRYAAKVVKNVRIAPSPMWLRQYLHAAGMRSINNIVDITNFIMLETGHPMHAFDLSKVRNRHIIVRRAEKGETLRTLDGKDHELSGGELMICDESRPTGLAGIMGGEESEITEETREILFECAAFDRTSIRVTSRRLGMRTESSGRFERGVSPATVMDALNRACQMINLLDAGDVVSGVIDLYPLPQTPVTLNVSCRRIAARTGVDIRPEEMVDILRKLLFTVTRDGDTLCVTSPAFRQDIEQEADICEEVLRYAGYARIPNTLMTGETTRGGLNEKQRRFAFIRELLSGMGFYEIDTFSFIAQKAIDQLGLPAEDNRNRPVVLRNPLGEDTACMRTTLLCGLIKTLSTNMNGGNEAGRIYELGNIFDGKERTEENLPLEKPMLSLGVYGKKEDFYTLRGTIEAILNKLGVAYEISSCGESYLHPGRRAALVSGEQVLAMLGEMHPDAADRMDIPARAYIAEIDLAAMWSTAKPFGYVKSIARMPAVTRDLALVMDDNQPIGIVMSAMRAACGEICEDIRMFDIYRGAQLGAGKKSVAFSLTFRAPDRTLNEEELLRLVNRVLKTVKDRFGAGIRS